MYFFNHSASEIRGSKLWLYVPLIFSGFYFLPLVLYPTFSAVKIALIVTIYALFIALYCYGLKQKGAPLLGLLTIMTLLCVFGTSITWGTQALFGYIAYYCGFSFVGRYSRIALAVLVATIVITGLVFISQGLSYFFSITFLVCAGVYGFGVAGRSELQHYCEKEQSKKEIENLSAIAERERIARDLHDILGHSLSSIALKAELAEKQLANEQYTPAKQEIAQVANLARTLLNDVRQAVSQLKTIGLSGELSKLKTLLTEQGISVQFPASVPVLPAPLETALCFICKEAVTNVLRHSQASQVSILLTQQQANLVVSISDNGVGTSKQKNVKPRNTGMGLQGIKERTTALGGTYRVEAENGFALHLQFPLQNNEVQL